MSVETADVGRGIEIAYEAFGDPGDPPVLLIMGLATQMLGWAAGFCEELARHGFRVIRFDNRDVGLSTHLDDAPPVDLGKLGEGDRAQAVYSLSDMAADAAGLLDALDIPAAHVVGASMGGMIAQLLTVQHPEKVLSLTSIMSQTGAPGVGAPSEVGLQVLLAPAARTREEAIERAVAGYRAIGSPGFERDDEAVRERAALSYDRAHDPAGVLRQLAAVVTAEDRTARLQEIRVPVLVVHGDSDELVDASGGRATHAAIPGSELWIVEGMGHDLPRGLWPELARRIATVARRGQAPFRHAGEAAA